MQCCCWSHAWWWTLTLVTTAPRATGIFIVCSGECPGARFVSKHHVCGVCKAVSAQSRPIGWPPCVARAEELVKVMAGGAETWGGGSEKSSEGCLLGLMTVMRLLSSVVFFLTGSLWKDFLFPFSVPPSPPLRIIFVRKERCAKAKGLLRSKTTLSCCYVCRKNPKFRDLLEKWAQRLTATPPSATRGSSS